VRLHINGEPPSCVTCNLHELQNPITTIQIHNRSHWPATMCREVWTLFIDCNCHYPSSYELCSRQKEINSNKTTAFGARNPRPCTDRLVVFDEIPNMCMLCQQAGEPGGRRVFYDETGREWAIIGRRGNTAPLGDVEYGVLTVLRGQYAHLPANFT